MSLSISANDLKFTIFASGHDYTLADSGDGEVQIFSNPFVPKGSKNYRGQYLLWVPDENGDPLDCVKDDVAHCTFTPALGSTFSIVGETTVEIHYHREYIYDESTVVVDKIATQKIMVVNHGSVVDSVTNLDVYSDGYGFIRPQNVNTVEVKDYSITGKNAVTKLSSFPWRATGLGAGSIYGFFSSTNLTDISEFAFADTSKCTKFTSLFAGDRSLVDISAVEGWDTSNVTSITEMVSYTSIASLKPLASWNTSKVTDMERAFAGFVGTSLAGLDNWDVSKVTNMRQIFDHAENLTNAEAIANWDVSKVQRMDYAFSVNRLTNTNFLSNWVVTSLKNMQGLFKLSEYLTDLSGLSGWQADIENISEAFSGCISLRDISGVHGLRTAAVTNFAEVFAYCTFITTLDGLEGWDVSNGQRFFRMFKGCPWIADISALANWNMSHATELGEMFMGCAWITKVDDLVNWRLPNIQGIGSFLHQCRGCYSSKIGKRLWYNAYYFYDYEDHQYINSNVQDEDNPLTYPTYDAAGGANWISSGTGWNAFENTWVNRPTWN